jgi:hypothetical protein
MSAISENIRPPASAAAYHRAKTHSLKRPNIINIERNSTSAAAILSALFSSTYAFCDLCARQTWPDVGLFVSESDNEVSFTNGRKGAELKQPSR